MNDHDPLMQATVDKDTELGSSPTLSRLENCATRSEAENRIKETRFDLFGTHASSHEFLANWLPPCLLGGLWLGRRVNEDGEISGLVKLPPGDPGIN